MAVNKLIPSEALYEMTHIYTWRFLALTNLIYLTSPTLYAISTVGVDKYIISFTVKIFFFSSLIGVYYQSVIKKI